ncbi:type III PLP-dependent enzyme [Streptomyces sp. 549]|uniref:type III PLP-dependent enzyme n=1 Tax=Streptomyces sp. 549 TaxID=3049076 RepID=UPI0024C2C249|nr:type III PLP-dependent enzyme [Streptomyces sp. 549]MDK1475678.1 type III PLP-dependent enzyme [Streptomyces sp. 549]
MITSRAAARAAALAALPAYVYDLVALDDHARRVRQALPGPVELYYAAKANPDPRLLRALAPHLNGYEVSSGAELAHVRQAVPALPLAFGAPGKTEAELRRALELGVERFHLESAHELRMLAHLADRPVDVLLRVNLPQPASSAALTMGGRPSPFGLDPGGAERCLPLLDGTALRLRGVHAHLASGLDADTLVATAARIADWAARFDTRHRLGLTEVNVGGGMAVDYRAPDSRFDWERYGTGLARLLREHPRYTFRVEPGRALSAYCGWYVTEVLDLKHSHGEAFAVLRGGTHHLRTPAAKGHSQPFTVLPRDEWPHPWPRPAVEGEPVTLAGQLCTPKDVLAGPAPVDVLRAGDLVAFALAGAYAWNISHHDFLMHPRPDFHHLDHSDHPEYPDRPDQFDAVACQ